MNKTLRNLALVALVAAPFSAFAEIQGAGTEADPYQIATAADLTGACRKVLAAPGTTVYFVQTADIDMAGVKNYFAVNGTYGDYTNSIVYDGRNHVISNFAPDYVADGGAQGYYNGSIFGVLTGKVMNLGVVNAKVDMKGENKTAGILGAYFGHGNVVDKNYATSVVENVYVTGEIIAGNYNTGGMFGTTGSAVEFKNCFANVKYSGTGTRQGGIIGRVSNPATMTNCYVAGTVTGVGENVGLVVGEITASLVADGVVAFNTGAEKAVGKGTPESEITIANTAADKADGIEEVQGWEAFSATENVDGYPALASFAGATKPEGVQGSGTEVDPYQIATAEDLCGAYLLVQKNATGVTYFVQTADIDMAGVTEEYHAVNGGNGVYTAAINYDGQNHVIKNFNPVGNTDDAAQSNYYNSSVFGVMTGTLKNLGIVDADINSSNKLGYGIIGGYAGHSSAAAIAPVTTIENVYVTGSIKSEGSSYLGGMFGTTGSNVEVNNCFANVTIESKNPYSAGICGRLDHTLTLTGVYVAGTVNSTTALVASARTGKAPVVNGLDFVVFNTGSDIVYGSNIPVANIDITATMANTDATKADGIADVQEWDAFSATKVIKGFPILKSFEAYGELSGIFDAAVEDGSDAPAVYYNLQGVQVNNPENGIYIVRRGNKVTKEVIR